jgi:hypothetical protein
MNKKAQNKAAMHQMAIDTLLSASTMFINTHKHIGNDF